MAAKDSINWQWPVEPYDLSDDYWKFGDRVPRRWGLWARHLGDDVVVSAGTLVHAIGDGEVVLSQTLPGSNRQRSWGGVVVLRHNKTQDPKHPVYVKASAGKQTFYSIYGHLKDLNVKIGDEVKRGQGLGVVAGSYTAENGWWKVPHLHFAIYTGPWRGRVLPGYWRIERFWRTRLGWWHDPRDFIASYLTDDNIE